MKENSDMYTIDITSKSPSVRAYLMELVLEMLGNVDDDKIESLYQKDDEDKNLEETVTEVTGSVN